MQVYTDVDAPAWLLLAVDQVLHPVDVVEAQRDRGYEALQRDLDGQPKVFLQQRAGQRSHRLRFFKVDTKRKPDLRWNIPSNTTKGHHLKCGPKTKKTKQIILKGGEHQPLGIEP